MQAMYLPLVSISPPHTPCVSRERVDGKKEADEGFIFFLKNVLVLVSCVRVCKAMPIAMYVYPTPPTPAQTIFRS